jgi:hypothetical protein
MSLMKIPAPPRKKGHTIDAKLAAAPMAIHPSTLSRAFIDFPSG